MYSMIQLCFSTPALPGQAALQSACMAAGLGASTHRIPLAACYMAPFVRLPRPQGKRRYSARNQPLVLLPRRWRPKVMKRRRSLAQVEAAGQQQYEQQTEVEGEEGQEKPGDGGQAQQGQQQQQAEQQQEAARPLAGVAGLRSATSAFQPLGTAAAQPGPGSQPNAASAGQPPVQQGHPGAQPGGPSLASLQVGDGGVGGRAARGLVRLVHAWPGPAWQRCGGNAAARCSGPGPGLS